MQPTNGDVHAFLGRVASATRRRDAETLIELMGRITGETPVMWGTIVGFGAYHYVYPTGTAGDAPAAAFAPRKAASTIYLPDGVGRYEDALARLGPHTTGVGCLYLKNLDDVDVSVLEEIVDASLRTVTSAPFGARARDGGA